MSPEKLHNIKIYAGSIVSMAESLEKNIIGHEGSLSNPLRPMEDSDRKYMQRDIANYINKLAQVFYAE